MECKLKRCCTSSRLWRPYCVDRLTSLPDELLGRILSLLPTKDVAVVQVLSKRMRPVFSWLTSIYLDDSSLRKCYECPLLAQRLPLYEAFIDNVLDKLHHNRSLTRFKLRLGGDFSFRCFGHHGNGGIRRQFCFPYVKPTRFNKWIGYPLANCGLRELHLSFYIGNPSECKLPPQIFDYCPSLEVLCLDSNIEIRDGVEFQRICLPKLKILHMHSLVFNEGDFITRLVSSCHALEELVITYRVWKKLDRMAIHYDSLRKLDLLFVDMKGERPNTNLVLIDTPNLQYLKYRDNLSHRYSIPHLNALVEAHIEIYGPLTHEPSETSARIQLSLLSALSNVQHLSLLWRAAQILHYASELNDQVFVFRYLKTLELGAFDCGRWDIVLLLILRFSPFLETLVFSQGFFHDPEDIYVDDLEEFVLEAEGWATSKLIPSCFLTHLKRIELKRCFGYERELNMIKFLVSKALVLKEFVTRLTNETGCINLDPTHERIENDLDEFKRTLDNLPTASDSCSIIVSR